jgi:hypothetical protein
MAKITIDDILGLQFKKELYGIDLDDDFDTFIEGVIAEQALIIEGIVGYSTYASATSPTKDFVKRAEKCYVAAEMVQRRINIILSNVVGAGNEIDVSHEGAQKKAYLDEAKMWLSRLTNDDFACGALETSHFESTTLAGEEV